jgi:hypothetical protein
MICRNSKKPLSVNFGFLVKKVKKRSFLTIFTVFGKSEKSEKTPKNRFLDPKKGTMNPR